MVIFPDINADNLRFVTAADCSIPPGHEHILTLASDTIINGDVFLVLSGHYISGGLTIAPSLVGSMIVERWSQQLRLLLLLSCPRAPLWLALPTPNNFLSCFFLQGEPPSSATRTNGEATTTALMAAINPNLPAAQKGAHLALLQNPSASFNVHSKTLCRTSVAVHRIDTQGNTIVRHHLYRVSSSERKIIADVANMLEWDVIRPSSSSWFSPVTLVRRKDGLVRFCIDYRAPNKITHKNVYLMPRIDDALDSLQGVEFSSLDLRSGYWKIPMHEADKNKTVFATPDGLYKFNVMPFGLCNAPATYECMIDALLRSLKWKTCLCYLDDIVIFSTTFC